MCCADDKGPILAVLDCKLDCTWMDFCFCMDMYTRVYVLQVSWKKMLKKFWIKEFALKHGSGGGGGLFLLNILTWSEDFLEIQILKC